MRAVVQRVKKAAVDILSLDSSSAKYALENGADSAPVGNSPFEPFRSGEIGAGLLVLLGVENGDTQADAEWLSAKIAHLRIFPDSEGLMNLSVADTGGEVLVVSQFTLLGNLRKGTRPSFNRSARAEESFSLYGAFCGGISKSLGSGKIRKGVFGAMMDVSLVNDGPVTIILDSRNRDI